MKSALFAAAALLGLTVSGTSWADTIVRHQGAAQSPILAGVSVPASATYLYLSGQVPSPVDTAKDAADPAAYGDTKTQAVTVFRKIDALLKAQGYALGDVIKLTVFLVGDPKQGGRQDFKGFQAAYSEFFGTAAQPNIVARSTVQVAALANPGFLVEIEATAAK
jgi:enamine deaminase RidA (YjgF/YER057c/UK114 family)